MNLIGIAGVKQAGKGSVAGFIKEWAQGRGQVAVEHGFADKLKLSCCRIFFPDCDMEFALAWAERMKVSGRAMAAVGVSGDNVVEIHGRTLYQRYGTESHREVFGESFWVDQLLPNDAWWRNFSYLREPFTNESDHEYHAPAHYSLVSDVRFQNEARRIKVLGGQVWQVMRPGYELDEHVSERPLGFDRIDLTIVNGASLGSLREATFEVCERVFGA